MVGRNDSCSVAAINRPELDACGRIVPALAEATKRKIRTMLRIGLIHGHDAIVLGAWGCGAFRNPPEHMAELFHQVLLEPEFANKFKVVRFAGRYMPSQNESEGKKGV